MKRLPIVMILIVSLLNLTVGCSNEQNPATNAANTATDGLTVQLPDATVQLKASDTDHDRGRTVMDLTYEAEGSVVARRLTLSKGNIPNGPVSYSAKLTDLQGNLKWEMATLVDSSRPNSYGLIERTDRDELSIDVTVDSLLVTEQYTLNGVIFTIEYTEQEVQTCLRLMEMCEMDPGYTLTAEEQAIVAKFKAFTDFYSTNTSLDNNIDGNISVGILCDNEFSSWAMDDATTAYYKLDPAVTKMCEIAGDVAFLKCPFGGIANPVCHAASGLVIACILAKVLDKICS